MVCRTFPPAGSVALLSPSTRVIGTDMADRSRPSRTATRRRAAPWPAFLLPILLLVTLAATNPDEDQFRAVMRAQDRLMLDVASLLPIRRDNLIVASRFTIQYGVGETVCWGAAAYVFVCPKRS